MSDRLITGQGEFEEFCTHIRESGTVAFDTEFISEHTFRPQLCLVQLATREFCAVVDPFTVDLTTWWEIMKDDQTTVIVHAGREETRFCLSCGHDRPRRLVDIQLAEGLRGTSYPLSYDRVIGRVIGKSVHSTETRTDWQRRPLTKKQISYALDDVRYVIEVWDRQRQWLSERGRLSWAETEFERIIDDAVAERGDDSWTRLSGVRRLNSRELAVARELYQWRESVAEERNIPVRRVLRDDLLVDLARRQPQTEAEVLNSRDMTRSNFRRGAEEIIECIQKALAIPRQDLPPRFENHDSGPDEPVLGKLLALALANLCAEQEVSPTLVGNSADLRQLLRWYQTGCPADSRPRLNTGWRAHVCGDVLKDVIEGKVSLRVADPDSEHPLVFERRG